MSHETIYKDEFIAIDFETANSAYYSACSIGIVRVIGTEITESVSYLIQPPDNFYNSKTIAVHGIEPKDTENADKFPATWEKIKHFFDDTYVVAHNANFDMSVLKAALSYYNISFPRFSYFCSIPVSGKNVKSGVHVAKSLDARCKYYGIPLEDHHDALCDATACAKLVILALSKSRYKTIDTFIGGYNFKSFDEVKLKTTFKMSGFDTTMAKEVAITVEVVPDKIDSDFIGKTFVFTGEVTGMSRDHVYSKVIAGGGQVSDNVTKKVDFLVNADNRTSGKLNKALDLQEKGHHIKILSGDDFIEMLNN